MTDDKTPTVGGFNAAQAQALGSNGSNVPSYASLRRRAADGIVASNVGYATRSATGSGIGIGPSGVGGTFPMQSGTGTLRPGESVRQLRGFPDIEEAIGQGPPPLNSSTSSNPSPSLSSAAGASSATSSTNNHNGTDLSGSPSTSGSSSQFATIAREVWRWFEEHLDQLLESVRSFRLDTYEQQVRMFWAGLSGEHKEIVHAPAVAGLMAKADALVYDVCPFCDSPFFILRSN